VPEAEVNPGILNVC